MADPEEILPPDDDRRDAIIALALAHFTEDADHLNYDWVYEQLGMERGKKIGTSLLQLALPGALQDAAAAAA